MDESIEKNIKKYEWNMQQLGDSAKRPNLWALKKEKRGKLKA
jgi:hypothetical protein